MCQSLKANSSKSKPLLERLNCKFTASRYTINELYHVPCQRKPDRITLSSNFLFPPLTRPPHPTPLFFDRKLYKSSGYAQIVPIIGDDLKQKLNWEVGVEVLGRWWSHTTTADKQRIYRLSWAGRLAFQKCLEWLFEYLVSSPMLHIHAEEYSNCWWTQTCHTSKCPYCKRILMS